VREPGAVVRLSEMNELIDVRAVLATISVPTLAVHATGDNAVPFASGEYLARHIPGARFLPIDFNAHLSMLQTTGAIVDWSTISRSSSPACRTGRLHRSSAVDRVVHRLVDSTARASRLGDADWRQLLDRHDRLVGREIDRHIAASW